MEDVELVIKIPRAYYELVLERCKDPVLLNAFKNGILLPRGHGKLKDTDKISDELERLRDSWNQYGNEYESGKYEGYDYALDEVLDAPTIIEADKEE